MKRILVVTGVIVFSIYISGCGKKQAGLEETSEPMSMETLSTMDTTTPVAAETKTPTPIPEAKPEVTLSQSAQTSKLEPLPPAGPYKPSANEIQTALNNAGFYTGSIDGKIGPATKKAAEEFQKAKGLQVDGKVGPKTWAALSQYLNPQPVATKSGKKR